MFVCLFVHTEQGHHLNLGLVIQFIQVFFTKIIQKVCSFLWILRHYLPSTKIPFQSENESSAVKALWNCLKVTKFMTSWTSLIFIQNI